MNAKDFRQSLVFFVVICFVHQVGAEDISAVACEANDGGVCTSKDANAECKTGETTCSCKENYIFNGEKSKCTKTITGTTCTENINCEGVESNSECDTAEGKCMCKSGYSVDPETDIKCLKDMVVGKTCTNAAGCAADPNAECTNGTCSCKTYYVDVNRMCEKIIGQACSSANATTVCTVIYSECKDNTCKCMSGYREYAGMCENVLKGNCAQTSDCNTLANAVCTDKKCTCATGYVKENVVCKVGINKTCAADGDCVANAKCTGMPKTCTCVDGYHPNSEKSSCICGAAGMIVVQFTVMVASVFLAFMSTF